MCGAGEYSPLSNQPMCFSCGAGTHNANDGTDSSGHDSEDDCVPCAGGYYSGKGASSCTACGSDNTYSGEGAISCSTCPAGYSTSGGDYTTRSRCEPCPGLAVRRHEHRDGLRSGHVLGRGSVVVRVVSGRHAPPRRPERVQRLRRRQPVEREQGARLLGVSPELVHVRRHKHDAHRMQRVSPRPLL